MAKKERAYAAACMNIGCLTTPYRNNSPRSSALKTN